MVSGEHPSAQEKILFGEVGNQFKRFRADRATFGSGREHPRRDLRHAEPQEGGFEAIVSYVGKITNTQLAKSTLGGLFCRERRPCTTWCFSSQAASVIEMVPRFVHTIAASLPRCLRVGASDLLLTS